MGANHTSSDFYCSMHMNIEFSTGRMQWENNELNWAQGQTGWPRSVANYRTQIYLKDHYML
jgi:deoxyribodipyrimidine photolyase